MLAIKNTLMRLPKIKVITQCNSSLMKNIYEQIDPLEDIFILLEESISEEAP